jgi:hypothetical protein
MNKNPSTPTQTSRAARCFLCDAPVAFGSLLRYEPLRTRSKMSQRQRAVEVVCCASCESEIFAQPQTLWTIVATYTFQTNKGV